jgi:opacity protein-like surface antigen
MKKLIVAFCVISVPVFAASSRAEVDHPSPSIGIQAGLNFETAKTPAQISSNTNTGASIGVNLDIPIVSHIFSIQPELNYTRRGFDLLNGGGAKASVTYNSLELPVFAKLSFGEGIRPFIFAGPMGIWNVSTDVSGSLGGTGGTVSFDPKTFDLAAVGGVGLDVGPFFVDARYVVGITDINQNSADWQSRGFRLMAGISF